MTTVTDILTLYRTVDCLRRRGLDRVTCDRLLTAGPAGGGLELARELAAGSDEMIRAVAAERAAPVDLDAEIGDLVNLVHKGSTTPVRVADVIRTKGDPYTVAVIPGVKAADITDAQFLDAMRTAMGIRPGWVTRWDLGCVLDGHPEWVGQRQATDGSVAFPEKVLLAKARRMIRRGLITGCACGCRGGFQIAGGRVAQLDLQVT